MDYYVTLWFDVTIEQAFRSSPKYVPEKELA